MDELGVESLKKRFNEGLQQRARLADYDYVKVLLLFWDGSTKESREFRDEGRELGKFLTQHFKFPVKEFAIPSELSELSLKTTIAGEVITASKATKDNHAPSLLIIHYGGHGDYDEDGAIWAALATAQENESLVHWNKIQDTLEDSKADILLLLDCCFSAHAGRARAMPSRIEVLTASAKKEMTPLPGPYSFTTALQNLMLDSLMVGRQTTVETLHSQLLRREAKLYTTPVRFALRPGISDRSIRLAPIGEPSIEPMERDLPGPCIRLLIRTAELSHDNVDELVSWLRSDIPSNIALEIESIAGRTATIQGLIHNIPQRNLPISRNLDSDTVAGILPIWGAVSELLSRYKIRRESLQGTGENIAELQEQAQKLLDHLKSQNAEIIDTIEQGLLQSPEMYDAVKLDEVMNDPTAASLGITDQLRLLRIIQSPADHQHHGSLKDTSEEPQSGKTTVWRELKKYGKYLDPEQLPEVEARVELLAELLNATKNPSFCSLRCSRWYHDPLNDQFILEFDVPEAYIQESGTYHHSSLKKIITDVTGSHRPSLGQRFQIAFLMAKAVRQWHSVGWLHQSISGHNIIFFKNENDIDYSMPFLQGFDFARPNVGPSIGRYVDDVSQNVYRHRDRQGPTRKGHKRIHDIYSLGVVLLEIGLWEDASITAGARKKDLVVDKMIRNLHAAATNRLGHYAGKDYQEAVLACLEGDFGIQEDDEEGSRLSKQFQIRVLDKLAKTSSLR